MAWFRSSCRSVCGAALGIALLWPGLAPGALIPGLFNTGTDNSGGLLSSNTVDPHYTLLVSPDAAYPGPAVYTLSPGFPVPPWMAEGPYSRWIAPRPEQNMGNAEGNFTYRTTFDLTGYDSTKAVIAGKWSMDNSGLDILLNGTSLGIVNNAGFGGFLDFTISSGFVAGLNTLDFVVNNAAPSSNPTALRVEMLGTVEVAGEPPSIYRQPSGQTVVAGENATFTVIALGEPILSYQWRFDGVDLPGETAATLALTAVTTNQAGQYDVVVSNNNGVTNSVPVTLTVLTPLPGLFNTGVDDNRAVLADYSVDPHYRLVVNADSASADALVQDSTVFPISDGTWLPNSGTSKWIGPRGETSGAMRGDYTYRLILDLTGLDPDTAFITGDWTSDNDGVGIFLNGASTGISHLGEFNTLHAFAITTGFVSGTNTLEFKVFNSDVTGHGYTGLRVQNLRGGAAYRADANFPPKVVAQPQNQLALTGESVSFIVVADGTPPLSYQWQFNGSPLPDETNATLTLTGVTTNNAGPYSVLVTNPFGSTNSVDAILTVLPPIPGLFNTGVDGAGALLGPNMPDPHFFLVISPDAVARGPLAFTLNDAWPVAPAGPWVAEGPNSRWIAPQSDQGAGNAPGTYVYYTSFDLTGFEPSTAIIRGKWAADDRVLDVNLNGASLGLANDGGFQSMAEFTISSGFIAGENILAILVYNGGEAGSPTGLRVEWRGGARPATCIWPSPTRWQSYPGQSNQSVTVTIPPGLNQAGDVNVTVTSANPAVAEPLGAVGGSLTLTFPAGGPIARSLKVAARNVGTTTFTLTGPDGVCIGASTTIAVGESLIANPSFENNYNAGWPHYSSIDNWRNFPGGLGVNQADGPFHDNGAIPDRSRVAFIQGSGGIYQVLWGLRPGQPYWLQFRYNERQGDNGPISLKVRFDGQIVDDLPNINPVGGSNPYYSRTVPVVAAAEFGLLEFATAASVDASLLLDAVCLVPRATNEVVLRNPSFEASGVVAYPGYIAPQPIDGWTATGDCGVNRSGEGPFTDNGLAADQRGVLFVQHLNAVSQELTGLEPGAVYQLSFAYNARSCCDGAQPHVSVTVGGSSVAEIDVTAVGNAPFATTNVFFTATSSNVLLAFAQTAGGDATLLLDDVHVAFFRSPEVRLSISYDPEFGVIRLAWPATAVGYRVEIAADLNEGFFDSGLPYEVMGDEFVAFDIADLWMKFYRLARP